jgi:hypothetical protein
MFNKNKKLQRAKISITFRIIGFVLVLNCIVGSWVPYDLQ